MPLRLFDRDEQPCKRLAFSSGEGHGNLALFQLCLVDDGSRAINAHSIINAGDEEEQADIGIAVDVLIRLEQLVASHVREQEMPVVEHLHKPWFAPLGEASQRPSLSLVAMMANGARRMNSCT